MGFFSSSAHCIDKSFKIQDDKIKIKKENIEWKSEIIDFKVKMCIVRRPQNLKKNPPLVLTFTQ